MKSLSERKRALLEQSNQFRQDLVAERAALHARAHTFSSRARSSRWWLVGAALGAGFLLPKRVRVFRWLPAATTAWRMIRRVIDSKQT